MGPSWVPRGLTKAKLREYPRRLEIDFENDPRVVIYGENASQDAPLPKMRIYLVKCMTIII